MNSDLKHKVVMTRYIRRKKYPYDYFVVSNILQCIDASDTRIINIYTHLNPVGNQS